METLKKSIWVIKGRGKRGGAICVDDSGLLMATIFGAGEENVVAIDDSGHSWNANLVDKYDQFGLLLYQIQQENGADVTFGCIDMGGDGFLRTTDRVFCFLHHNFLSYSALETTSAYAFPIDVDIPDNDVDIVQNLSEQDKTDLFFGSKDSNPPYRTVANVLDLERCGEPVNPGETVYFPEALRLWVNLPLLHFCGLSYDSKETHQGTSGCPVFNEKDHALVGLILFNVNSSSFILPLCILQHCIRKRGTSSGERGSGSGSGSGGGR